MDRKIVGKTTAPIALLIVGLIAPVAKNIKITIRDKINNQTVLELDSMFSMEEDIEKMINYLTSEKSYRYTVEFEASLVWPYVIDESIIKAFNIPNCCEISLVH